MLHCWWCEAAFGQFLAAEVGDVRRAGGAQHSQAAREGDMDAIMMEGGWGPQLVHSWW